MSNTPTHGSDVQETPDWWKASDGRFYPPELHPDYVKLQEPAPPVAPAAHEPSVASESSGTSMSSLSETVGGDGAADSAGVSEADDLKSTIPAAAPEVPLSQQTIIQRPGMPLDSPSMPSPDAPPAMPPSPSVPSSDAPSAMPPSPSVPSSDAPSAMPPSPSVPSSDAPSAVPPSPSVPSSDAPSAVPPSPSVPSSDAPSAVPPSPSVPSSDAPPAMPPAPTSAPPTPPSPVAPAPAADPEPGGSAYGAPAQSSMATLGPPVSQPPSGFQPPAAAPAAKRSSRVSGIIALIAGAAAIAGSLLQWGKGSVVGANGVEKAIIEVAGFDSSGIITAICGGVLILAGILFFMGVPRQLNWAILAFLGGSVIVGAVVFSMIDIGDLSNRQAAEWQSQGLASVGDVISTQPDLGLWITGAAGVLGVLAAPFVNRS